MADLNTTYESLLEELSVIRDERAMHTNTATRVGTAMIHMLQFSKASFDSLVDAIGELDFDTYWEEYTDSTTNQKSVKLKSQYAGAWTEGFLSGLGYGPGGSGGGVTLNEPLESINNSGLSAPGTNENGKTIVWNNTTGKWEYGSAGGGTDLNAVWDSLGSVDGTKQIDLSHLTNALAGYATQSWVTSQGYLTSLPSHNHDDRYKFGTIGVGTVQITLGGTTKSVLTSHQSLADYVKTIQLGTNGTVYSPTSGKVTLPAYPTTLPASDVYSWAKAANKPSYSFSEINNHPTTLAGYGITDAKISNGVITLGSNSITPVTSLSGYATESWVTDNMMKKARLDTTANIDTLYDAGSYRFSATAQGTWPVASNYGQVLVVRGADDTIAQMFFPYVESKVYLRTGNPMSPNNGSWHAWKELATTGGNIASATKLQTARTLWGQSFDGTANVSGDMSSVGSITMSGSIIMNNIQNIYIKDSGGTPINCVTFNSYNTFALGYGARINNHNTDIQGSYITFATNNGQTSGDHRIEALKIRGGGLLELHYGAMFNNNNIIGFKDSGGTEKTILRLNNNNQLELGYGSAGSDYLTQIFGGATTGIRFYQGTTTLAASVEGGDHSFVAYYHIKLTTNNQSLYTRNTNSTPIDTVRMGSNNILNFGYGCSTNNHETRIYGGATAGIGFYCGSTEVARVHKDAARQGIRIGDGLLSWDSANNALKVSKIDGQGNEVAANFYSLGGLSGLGFTAPQSSLEAFHIDYLTSTSVTAQTMQAIRFYLNSSIYLYLDGSSLKITNGTTTKTIITL